jgi:hypothetical protein
MKRAMRLRGLGIVAALWALSSIATPACAQTKTGTTIGDFLLIEPSARISGMGNAGAALAYGLESVYYNPGAIGLQDGVQVLFDHDLWIADISYDYVAGALPLGRWGNAYASVTALNSGDIAVRTVAQPLGTGEQYHVSDIAIGLGYGKQITDRFSAGAQVNFVQETIWHTSLATVTGSVGTLYTVSDNGLHLGASLSNFGTQAKYSGSDLRITYDQDPNRQGDNSQLPGEVFSDAFSVPALFRVGLGFPIRLASTTRLQLAVDAAHPSDNTESVSAGAELDYRHQLALRVGYQNAFQQDSEEGLTAGGGIEGKLEDYAYRFDYAWADQGRLGTSHRFSLALHF